MQFGHQGDFALARALSAELGRIWDDIEEGVEIAGYVKDRLSDDWLGGSVPVKCPTATGSLAGNVARSPSSNSSSRRRFSFLSLGADRRMSIRSKASACATSSGSSPSSLPAAI